MSLSVLIEFSGGAELLFGNMKKLSLELDGSSKWNLKKLIKHLHDNHLKERSELFVSGDTVRPGILVLVNDVDWELLGDKDYEIQPNDNVLFISTLHGG
ncbi:hypothetical protein RDWZM_000769 [Blomia tropicalis]|uniref:Ubiquitin-related modifier 1 homolog n=1 Tax=Blomia tropicalis TaxID=40697 RepID=A0A9Q0MAV6_BLOTA|nr:Ubiquitin- modifier 1 [Blomia tropicalis]KAJ6222224.1 hypothetical protein RDWZM_000769 [Blomia tropicalis]